MDVKLVKGNNNLELNGLGLPDIIQHNSIDFRDDIQFSGRADLMQI